MGQSIAKAVQQKGKKATNPTWSGWIYLIKNGLLQSTPVWKRRYCRVTNDKLYYFRDDSPSKGSKGWISLVDMIAMVHLPGRGENERVPFLLLATNTFLLVAFESVDLKNAFSDHLCEQHRIPIMPIVTEDWSIVQLDTKKQPSMFVRYFLLFVGSGDLLFFTDGTAMELVYRVRMVEMKNVHVVYDAAAGNGVVLSPRSRALAAARIDGPTIDIVLQDRTLCLEFDAMTQYEKWRELLVDALAGDYTGAQFQQRQVIATRRKHYERQQKLDDMKKKRKTKKTQRYSTTSFLPPDAFLSSRTTSAADPSEWSTVSDSSAHEYYTSDDNASTYTASTITKKKKSKKKRADTGEWSDTQSIVKSEKRKSKAAEKRNHVNSPTVEKTQVRDLQKKRTDTGEWSDTQSSSKSERRRTKGTAKQENLISPAVETPFSADILAQKQRADTGEWSDTQSSSKSERRKSKTKTKQENPVVDQQPQSEATQLQHNQSSSREPVVEPPHDKSQGDVVAAKDPKPLRRRRERIDLFASSPKNATVFETKRSDLLARLSTPNATPPPPPPPAKMSSFEVKRQNLLARLTEYSPLSPKIATTATTATSIQVDLTPPSPPPRRRTSIQKGLQLDLQKRHELLQKDFARLQQSMQGDERQKKRLQRQIDACARAIDTLGALAMFPPEEPSAPPVLDAALLRLHGAVEVKGNWYTTELRGGPRVRHWKPRPPSISSS
ncbi:unnamed protein product [Aphanomyces euteiches]|uniref:PH domain-containing protein n=1 Tax=Aphanomyces euteiches TaxID=100861 RepID=A0A6G0WTB4_9STRA|nr:hypothetical protein Ae201684_011855 [Aphanomyces euteiches]KAH9089263.1 hypothetical protein Ae201684P_001466 [Aphanomyces euteiches]KAH9133039.1 hypothetical protein AeRB84_020775 [Aphanomyces euteiches]